MGVAERIEGDKSPIGRLALTDHELSTLFDLMHEPVANAQRRRKGEEYTLLLTNVYRKVERGLDEVHAAERTEGG